MHQLHLVSPHVTHNFPLDFLGVQGCKQTSFRNYSTVFLLLLLNVVFISFLVKDCKTKEESLFVVTFQVNFHKSFVLLKCHLSVSYMCVLWD